MNKKDTLSEKEIEQFYRLKNNLYLFVNKNLNVLKYANDWEDMKNNDPELILKIRDYVFKKDISIIDNYLKQNPDNLIKEELEIVSNWKKVIPCEKAILFKHTNENSLFLVKNNVYGVIGLMDSLKDLFHGHAPVFLDFIIMPFKNKLVHEGFFRAYNISFGNTMAKGITLEAEEIIIKKGIITSLGNENNQKKVSDEDLLRFYMKSEANQHRFFEKIDDLKNKSEELKSIYNYEIGRINSRHIKKQLKEQNLRGYFGILFSQIIASGSTKEELMNNLKKIITKERENEIYIIKIK